MGEATTKSVLQKQEHLAVLGEGEHFHSQNVVAKIELDVMITLSKRIAVYVFFSPARSHSKLIRTS